MFTNVYSINIRVSVPHVIFQLFQIFISEMRYLIVFLVYISLMMNKGELLSFVLLVFILLWTD